MEYLAYLFVLQEINDGKQSPSSKITGECTGLSCGARYDLNGAFAYLLFPSGEERGDRWLEGKAHSLDGFQLLASGEKEKAKQCFSQSLVAFRDLKDREAEKKYRCHFSSGLSVFIMGVPSCPGLSAR